MLKIEWEIRSDKIIITWSGHMTDHMMECSGRIAENYLSIYINKLSQTSFSHNSTNTCTIPTV